jgi:hypothetical protein
MQSARAASRDGELARMEQRELGVAEEATMGRTSAATARESRALGVRAMNQASQGCARVSQASRASRSRSVALREEGAQKLEPKHRGTTMAERGSSALAVQKLGRIEEGRRARHRQGKAAARRLGERRGAASRERTEGGAESSAGESRAARLDVAAGEQGD